MAPYPRRPSYSFIEYILTNILSALSCPLKRLSVWSGIQLRDQELATARNAWRNS
jgi:hypothetical protein